MNCRIGADSKFPVCANIGNWANIFSKYLRFPGKNRGKLIANFLGTFEYESPDLFHSNGNILWLQIIS